ncbi:MAG: HXXEE domain-containing protein [Aestuariivirga sp.]
MAAYAQAMLNRLYNSWVYGAFLMSLVLVVLSPIYTPTWNRVQLLTFFSLLIYIFHQYEEHDGDRFRIFVNQILADGREALTKANVFWINVIYVWVLLAIVNLAVHCVAPGWAVAASYLLLVNALAHIGQAIVMRRPNPGVYTSIIFFVPLGSWLLVTAWPMATFTQQVVSFAAVIALHAHIVLLALSHKRKLGVK